MINKTILIIWTITLLICGGISYFVIYPGITGGLATYESTKKTNEELAASANKKQILTDLSKNNDLTGLTTIATNYIPEETKAAELILELTSIAANAGTAVDQLSFDNNATATPSTPSAVEGSTPIMATGGSSSGGANEVGFQMKISGDFDAIIKFLSLSEVSARLNSIKTINLSQDTTSGKISAQMSGNGFWKKNTATSTTDIKNVMITNDTIQRLKGLTQYSEPVDTETVTEEGFGRANPFADIN